MIIAVVATVVSLAATVLWIVALANGDSPFDDGGGGNSGDVTVHVVRGRRALAAAPRRRTAATPGSGGAAAAARLGTPVHPLHGGPCQ